jgi:hypothetical protein
MVTTEDDQSLLEMVLQCNNHQKDPYGWDASSPTPPTEFSSWLIGFGSIPIMPNLGDAYAPIIKRFCDHLGCD